MLLLHIFRVDSEGRDDIKITDPAISLSLCFPPTNVKPIERTYQVNKVYRNLIQKQDDEEVDDDEEAIMNGDL